MLNYSLAEENYLKAIYHLQLDAATVTTNSLAAAIRTKPASVTDMLKKLQRKKLVFYKAYYGCSLTDEGRHAALMIIRRHRLWEFFLSQKLGFSWNEVHQVAEELEHVSNEKLIDRLDAFLGYPSHDPHGDPIPDANGRCTESRKRRLFDLEPQRESTVTQIGNQSEAFLNLLQHKKISIGTRVELLQKFPFDQSIEIKTNGKHVMQLSKEISQNIFIENL